MWYIWHGHLNDVTWLSHISWSTDWCTDAGWCHDVCFQECWSVDVCDAEWGITFPGWKCRGNMLQHLTSRLLLSWRLLCWHLTGGKGLYLQYAGSRPQVRLVTSSIIHNMYIHVTHAAKDYTNTTHLYIYIYCIMLQYPTHSSGMHGALLDQESPCSPVHACAH